MKNRILPGRLLNYKQPVLVFAAIILLYGVGMYTGLLSVPRLKARDFFSGIRYRFHSPSENSDKLVIVGIGNEAYRSYGNKWPWTRDIFAALVYKISRCSPAVLGMDIGFIGKSAGAETNDFLLADSFKSAGNVILASYFTKDGKYILPYKEFWDSVLGYGFINKPVDMDGVVRETKLFQRHELEGRIMDYSLDVKVVSVFTGIPPEKIIPHTNGKAGIIPLNYSSRMKDLHVVSMQDILADRIDPGELRGKIVLVGTTGSIFHDIGNTPVGRMPGVIIVGNTVLMLMDKDFIHNIPAIVNILLLLAAGFVVSVVTWKKSIYYGSAAAFGMLFIFTAVSSFLVLNDFIWDFFSLPAVCLAVYMVNVFTNYTSLFLQSMRIKRFVLTDTLTGLPTRRYFLFKLENYLKDQKAGSGLSLVLFGIDNIHAAASGQGTGSVDESIKKAAELIQRHSRKTRGMDFISRYGEAEFCCILRNTGKEGAVLYIKRIRDIMGRMLNFTLSSACADNRDIKVRTALGFAKSADAALERARRENRICVYDPRKDVIPAVEYKEIRRMGEADLSYVAEELRDKYREMAILANKLYTAKEDVIRSEKLAAVGRLAAVIHHDIGIPVINMRSGLEKIKEGIDRVDSPALSLPKKFLNSAVEEARRLENQMEKFKALYRPAKKEILPVQVNRVLEETLDLLSGQLVKKRIKLIKRLFQGLPMVLSNTAELKQVFLNLLHNAIEAMPGGGELEVRSSIPRQKENMVETDVRDTGCGIPEEHMDKIFRAFFTTRSGEKGSGLGLYASMEIIRKYGGTIEVESIPGKGTIFKVYLPFAGRNASPAA